MKKVILSECSIVDTSYEIGPFNWVRVLHLCCSYADR